MSNFVSPVRADRLDGWYTTGRGSGSERPRACDYLASRGISRKQQAIAKMARGGELGETLRGPNGELLVHRAALDAVDWYSRRRGNAGLAEARLRRGEIEAALIERGHLLSDRAREVLAFRYGMATGRPETLATIAEVYDLHLARIGQIVRESLATLGLPEPGSLDDEDGDGDA